MKIEDLRGMLISFLSEIRATDSSHSGRTLSDHLLGTYDLLKKWNCDFSVCIAGGLHSIYGTNIYDIKTLSSKDRSKVRKRFGMVSERLAWLFGSLDRPGAIENGSGLSRKRSVIIKLDPIDVRSLRLIEAANLLEQGESLKDWPNIRKEVNGQKSSFEAKYRKDLVQ